MVDAGDIGGNNPHGERVVMTLCRPLHIFSVVIMMTKTGMH